MLFLKQMVHITAGFFNAVCQIVRKSIDFYLSGLDFRKVKHGVDEINEPVAALFAFRKIFPLLVVERAY